MSQTHRKKSSGIPRPTKTSSKNKENFEYATKSPNKTARKSAVTSREASGRKSHHASGRKSYVNPKSIERMQETDGFGTIKKQIKKNISQGSQKLASKIASIKRIVDDGPKSLRILYDTEEEMERTDMMIQEEKNKLLTEFKGLASKLQKLKDGEQDNLEIYERRRKSFNVEKPMDPAKAEFQKQVIVQLEKLNDKYQTLEKKMTDVHKQPKSMENSVATRKSHGDSQRKTHNDKEKERSRSKSKERERQKKKYLTGNSEIESLTDRSGYIKKPDEEFARLKKESEDDLMRLISSQGAFEESERKSKRKTLDRSEEKNRQKEKSSAEANSVMMHNLMKKEQELKMREQEANKREEHLTL